MRPFMATLVCVMLCTVWEAFDTNNFFDDVVSDRPYNKLLLHVIVLPQATDVLSSGL